MSHPSDRAAHPLERALGLARELRVAFALDAASLVWLLQRWRDVAALPLRDDVLRLVVEMLYRDQPPPPITKAEALHIAEAAAREHETLDDARHAAIAYGRARGGTPDQVLRLDTLTRDAWADLHRREVEHAA